MSFGRVRALACGAVLGALAPLVSPMAASAAPVVLDFSGPPPAPWTLDADEQARNTFQNGVLTMDSPGYDQWFLGDPNSSWAATVDNDTGWTLTFRLRIDPATQGDCPRRPVQVWIDDGVLALPIGFSRDAVCVTSRNGVSQAFTTTEWHTYEIRVKGAEVHIAADGQALLAFYEHPSDTGAPSLTFGDGDGNPGSASLAQWDSFAYDTTAGCTIVGTAGADTIVGTAGDDVICGLGGNDVIDGKQGNDVIRGGFGDDSLRGSSGDDLLDGGAGNDFVIGGGGNDRLRGGRGDDFFRADAVPDGSDDVWGEAGFDTMSYGFRTATVNVTLDHSWDDGSPTTNGGFEHDNVRVDVERAIGGSAGDTMKGDQPQQTTLWGGPGDDVLDVRDADGNPNDRIDGGDGRDTCLADPGVTLVRCP